MNIRKKAKLNKMQRAADRRDQLAYRLHGEGLYIFKNNTKGSLILPKPASGGQKTIEPGEEFEGDNYFMSLVQTNSLRLVRELISPEQERQKNMLNENTLNEEKLILDQPPTVTDKGAVEHVIADPAEKQVENIHEGKPSEKKSEVLLNEDPLDGVTILG